MKISQYSALTAPAANDLLPVVDVNDLTMAPSGTTKNITVGALGGPNWATVLNPAYAGGADPTGASDSSAAIQAALNALSAAGGGTLYVPAGNYEIATGLTWSSANPLRIAGAVAAGSKLRINSTATSFTLLSVTSCARFRMEHVSVLTDANTGAFSNTNIGVHLISVPWSSFSNVVMQTGTAPNRVNQGIVLTDSGSCDIDDCDIRGYVNAVYATSSSGTSAIIAVRGSSLSCNSGSGVTGGACFRADSNVATVHLNNVVMNSGDYGIYASQGSGTAYQPGFWFINDCEINNPAVGGVYLGSGSAWWAQQLWIADGGPGTGTVRHGIEADTGWQGLLSLENCNIGFCSGHGILLQGGAGATITDTSFGGNGGNAANTYDDVHIASGCSAVTIRGCHFEVDYSNTANHTRSGVYVELGATNALVDGNLFAASGYGTGPVVNLAASGTVRFRGNIGYNPVGLISSLPAVAGSGSAVTNTTGVDASVIVTVSASGGATSVAIGGHATGISSSTASAVLPPVRVPAGQTITLTYTNAPTWAWFGD